MLKDLERKSFLVKLIKRMQDKGSWTGETHIQKTVYCLQKLLNIPLQFNYVFYKHGPFSFELRDEIKELRAEDFLKMQPKDPYGATYLPGDEPFVSKLEDRFSEDIDNFVEQIEFITKKVSTKNVRELEKLSTALYVSEEEGITEIEEMIERMTELKPHISENDAEEAAKQLKEYQEEITENSLLLN